MSAERFLITGCGRSGTGYTAQLLTALGYQCGHEEIFSITAVSGGRVAWPDTYLGDSSWLAAPYLHEMPAGTAILHQVRDPLAVVRSLVRIRLFEVPGPYLEFLASHLEGIDRCPPVEAALRYWDEWNGLVEEASEIEGLTYCRYHLEEIDDATIASLLEHLGRTIDLDVVQRELQQRPTDYNTRGDVSRDDGISWETLPDCEAARAVAERATRYGYPLEAADNGEPRRV